MDYKGPMDAATFDRYLPTLSLGKNFSKKCRLKNGTHLSYLSKLDLNISVNISIK